MKILFLTSFLLLSLLANAYQYHTCLECHYLGHCWDAKKLDCTKEKTCQPLLAFTTEKEPCTKALVHKGNKFFKSRPGEQQTVTVPA